MSMSLLSRGRSSDGKITPTVGSDLDRVEGRDKGMPRRFSPLLSTISDDYIKYTFHV